MKPLPCLTSAFALVALWCLVFAQPAYAYIDPGTGSYFFQLLIASLFAGGFIIKMSWKSIRTFFRNLLAGGDKRGADGE